MGNTNYICIVVKVLEKPIPILGKNNVPSVRIYVQLPQSRNKMVVDLVLWGKLSQDVANYYGPDDYILVEGYLSVRERKIRTTKPTKKTEITAIRVYPFLLDSDRRTDKS